MRPEDATRLALTFPVLRGAEGVDPWSTNEFRRWLKVGQETFAERATTYAGLYVLLRWTGGTPEPCGAIREFNLIHALEAWDHEQQGAFLADILDITNPPGFCLPFSIALDTWRGPR